MVHVGAFPGGNILCRIIAFFDFTLATEYALLLIVMAIVLYTRRLPKFEDTLDDLPMQNQMNYSQPPSMSYPPVVRQQAPSRQSNGSRPPSVTASRTGSRQGIFSESRAIVRAGQWVQLHPSILRKINLHPSIVTENRV